MTPAASRASPQPTARLARYQDWLARERGLRFADYDALWHWSVTDLDAFWASIWDFFAIESPTSRGAVLADDRMPGARWFPGAQLNFARQVMRHADAAHAAGHPAIVFQNERMDAPMAITWPALRGQVAALARSMRAAGVRRGDRVAAWLPNTPHTVVAFLATASLGAVWSVCSPDMGPVAVLDRFRQIEPTWLFAVDGQTWGGVAHDRRPVLAQLLDGLPGLRHLAFVADLDPAATPDRFARPGLALYDWPTLVAGADDAGAAFEPDWLPFDHPLWIVYSSGTTGLPKPIVHGHGGIVLESLKGGLHNDVGPSIETDDRFFWYSSTGWIMWNASLAALLGGTTLCVYDGNPAGQGGRDWGVLWRFAAAAGATFFGAGAAYYAGCMKAGVEPMREADLAALRAVGSTGSPLADEAYQWIWDHLPRPGGQPIWIDCISGGTDFAGAFIGGNRTLPVVKGEMQCRCLGAAVQAFDEQGRSLLDEVGELVCTRPMPSMPLYLWGDADGARYRDSYFDMYPGVWRHGDWIRITPHPESGSSGAIIYGRSDATINRHGVRMGTAELYRAVEMLPEVLDSLVIDLEFLGRESWMPLFVVLREGLTLDEALTGRLKAAIRAALSPRHVPDDVFQVDAIPRTLSGKKMELPVKKLLLGADPAQVMNRDAMANANSVDWFVDLARRRAAARHG
jgi:acetoacetyl-CoA synthetase